MSDAKHNLITLRRQLLENGYSPIPNKDKACFLEGWPKVHIDDNAIKRWGRMHNTTATGLRVQDGLCVIDIDIDHPIIEDVIDAMLDTLPEEMRPERLERMGKGHKLAWYCQTNDLFSRLHTRRWVAPGDAVDEGTHSVEVFGGGSPRQFGSFGPHTIDSDGNTVVAYRWADETPEDVPLHALDVLSKDQLFAMLDAAERELQVQGFEPVVRTKRGEGTPGKVYDLTDDMMFDLADGQSVGLQELGAMVKEGYTGRCSASWLEGASAQNRQRCLVTRSGSGHVAIWESAAGDTHMPAAIAPSDNHSELVDRVAEKIREKQDKRRSRLTAEDDHVTGAAKLLLSYAFQTNAPRAPVVPLWGGAGELAMSLQNFRIQCLPFCGIEIGPKGGEKKINPVDVWLSNANRVVVAGQQMRPDLERPTFEEHGQKWVNTYVPPDLGAADGGDAEIGETFIEQLVPDMRERQWFRKWLAHKWQHPHIPGPAVIMVACDFGTGRGTFGRLLRALFGRAYIKDVPFKHYTGATYQSQYTDWARDALFAVVNESSAAGDQPMHKMKHDVYEHLKEMVDPAPTERLLVSKSGSSFYTTTCMTSLIMTNNLDAIPLPEDDRRFAVLSNGDKRDDDYWRVLNEWMDVRANLAAFARWLEETDLSDYNPYDPPLMTRAKRDMVDENKTVLDRAVTDAVTAMEGYFVPEQVLRHVQRSGVPLPENWRAPAEKEVARQAYRVAYPNGRHLAPQIGEKRYRVFHAVKSKAVTSSAVEVRRAIGKNGNVFSGDAVKELQRAHLKEVKEHE